MKLIATVRNAVNTEVIVCIHTGLMFTASKRHQRIHPVVTPLQRRARNNGIEPELLAALHQLRDSRCGDLSVILAEANAVFANADAIKARHEIARLKKLATLTQLATHEQKRLACLKQQFGDRP